ncbi:MAG: LemA family protein [Desulfuromonadaceae bacterium]|nr:LemA family protein [Desulfuromonas sp.]MDY0184808.1 LemA family protein [Desulfuromonadaceae bacterium]
MLGLIVSGVILLAVVALTAYVVLIYNTLVSMRNNSNKAWSNIDVLLKQRYDELPKLLEVCKGYMQHERETLEAVTKARSMIAAAGSQDSQLEAQNFLTDTLKSLFAVTENYPDLKADEAFRRLGTRISELEEQIADRRELFNEYVNIYNIRIAQFPDLMVATRFNFSPKILWQINPEHRRDVNITFTS